MSDVKRPWGEFKDLNEFIEGNVEVRTRRLIISPNQSLSYQAHVQRNEVWYIESGCGYVMLDGIEFLVKPGDYVQIPEKTFHRIRNIKHFPLHVLEVQIGEVLIDTDIYRVEDDYGRVDIDG